MNIENLHLPEQDDVTIIVDAVITRKQYPAYSITAASNCEAVISYTKNGYARVKTRIKLADIHSIIGVDAGGTLRFQYKGKQSYDQLFGPFSDVHHCFIVLMSGEIIVINDDIRLFGKYRWQVSNSYDGELIDDAFLASRNDDSNYWSESEKKDDYNQYVPPENPLAGDFTLPLGYSNPDTEGRYTTALFFPQMFMNEHRVIHTVKIKVPASQIKSVHLKSQFTTEQLRSWPTNVRDQFGSLVLLNDGRMIYTTTKSFPTLSWVRPTAVRMQAGSATSAPTMQLPNPKTSVSASTLTNPTASTPAVPVPNTGTLNTSVLRETDESLMESDDVTL